MTSVSYREAGVDLEAGTRAVELMKDAVRATYGPEVLLGIGAFGGLFDVSALKGMDRPVLVASTDGVGTKTKIATALDRFDTIGFDIVNHCINDILVQGARPLFFLDYIASSQINPEMVASVVQELCNGLPGRRLCASGRRDGRDAGRLRAGRVRPGGHDRGRGGSRTDHRRQQHRAWGSSHRPGISRAAHQRLLAGAACASGLGSASRRHPSWAEPLGEALLAPHRCYLAEVQRLQQAGLTIKGLAHITGGGLIDNPPRILPDGVAFHLHRGTWPIPPLFQLIQHAGRIDDHEMAHVFNLGLGMLVVVPADQANQALGLLEDAWLVGEAVAGERVCVIGDRVAGGRWQVAG